MDYSKLFTPFKIANCEIKNRLVMSPMGTNSGFTNGRKSDDEVDYFIERARGGVGLIIMGCQPLTEAIAQGSMEGYLDTFSVLPPLTSVCDGVHKYGAKIFCQISPGTGRNAFPDTFGNPPMSASAIPSTFNPDLICHAMTKKEIEEMMERFTFAAGVAKDAGYDGIEIHAHAGYLVDQFMSEVWNKRTDEYGGSLKKRMKFPCDIIKAIRKAVGSDFPISFRISLDHMFKGGRTMKDSLPMIKILEDAGVDVLDIDSGCYETLDYIFPPSYLGESCMSYVCKEARKTVNIPLMNAGTHNADSAVELLETGDVDFVMMGRALIADPQLPNKLMAGHPEDIRPCLRCNENCIGRIWNRHTKLSCSVNPAAMDERRCRITKTNEPKKLVVIGSGPAGLEAARVAAMEGHDVSIYEKNNKLGGTMGDICTADFKINIKKLTEWYIVQLGKLGVDVHLNYEMTADDPALVAADSIVIGAGSLPITPPIKGIGGANVITMVDAHRNPALIDGKNIVICGGGASGCDGAIEIAGEMGKNVTVVEMLPEIARDAMFINKISLTAKLAKNKVKILTNTKVVSIEKDSVTVENEKGKKEKIAADTVISAFGMKPDMSLVDQLKLKYPTKVRAVGDSSQLGKIGDAIRDGFGAAFSLQEHYV